MIENHRQNSKGGGIAILVRNNIPYKRRKDLEQYIENELETVYIEITCKNGKPVVIGSLYRAPNTSEKKLHNHCCETIQKIKSKRNKKELILGMDHNIDLLKSSTHTPTQEFLNMFLTNGVNPTITRPSRITNTSATLIDNIFISDSLSELCIGFTNRGYLGPPTSFCVAKANESH